jgi:hypothetical protein
MTRWSNQSAAANRRPAGQPDGAGNFSAIVAADRAFPAAVAELGRSARGKMKPTTFIPTVRRKVAVTAIGPSALRGQGKGVLKASQEFLSSMSLARVPASGEARFRSWLDRQTELLLDALPINGRPWGAARKAINLFLRDALYNQYLNRHFHLGKLESWLEVPLDSAVARGLKAEAGRDVLPRWPGLKHLKSEASAVFQAFASTYAHTHGIDRVHLDMYLWLENR